MLHWANTVLGRNTLYAGAVPSEHNSREGTSGSSSLTSHSVGSEQPSRRFSRLNRLDSLDAVHLGRLAGYVLQRLKSSEICMLSNRSQAQRGEPSSGARGEGEIGGDSRGTRSVISVATRVGIGWPRQASGGSGRGGGGGGLASDGRGGSGRLGKRTSEEPKLSIREENLWGKLLQLTDIPDSLAAFPVGLDTGAMKEMLDGRKPWLLASLVRFLMECDEAMAMRQDKYLNPLYSRSPPLRNSVRRIGGSGDVRPSKAFGPGSEERRRRPWNRSSSSPPFFTSGSWSILGVLPPPPLSLTAGAPEAVFDAAVARTVASVEVDKDDGPGVRTESPSLEYQQQQQKAAAGAASLTATATASPLSARSTRSPGAVRENDDGGSPPRASVVKATAKAAASPAAQAPAASVSSFSAARAVSVPPSRGGSDERSLANKFHSASGIPLGPEPAKAPPRATKSMPACDGGGGAPVSRTAEAGKAKAEGFVSARQMWERREISASGLQQGGTPRVDKRDMRCVSGSTKAGGSVHANDPLTEMGPGVGVANMKAIFEKNCGGGASPGNGGAGGGARGGTIFSSLKQSGSRGGSLRRSESLISGIYKPAAASTFATWSPSPPSPAAAQKASEGGSSPGCVPACATAVTWEEVMARDHHQQRASAVSRCGSNSGKVPLAPTDAATTNDERGGDAASGEGSAGVGGLALSPIAASNEEELSRGRRAVVDVSEPCSANNNCIISISNPLAKAGGEGSVVGEEGTMRGGEGGVEHAALVAEEEGVAKTGVLTEGADDGDRRRKSERLSTRPGLETRQGAGGGDGAVEGGGRLSLPSTHPATGKRNDGFGMDPDPTADSRFARKMEEGLVSNQGRRLTRDDLFEFGVLGPVSLGVTSERVEEGDDGDEVANGSVGSNGGGMLDLGEGPEASAGFQPQSTGDGSEGDGLGDVEVEDKAGPACGIIEEIIDVGIEAAVACGADELSLVRSLSKTADATRDAADSTIDAELREAAVSSPMTGVVPCEPLTQAIEREENDDPAAEEVACLVVGGGIIEEEETAAGLEGRMRGLFAPATETYAVDGRGHSAVPIPACENVRAKEVRSADLIMVAARQQSEALHRLDSRPPPFQDVVVARTCQVTTPSPPATESELAYPGQDQGCQNAPGPLATPLGSSSSSVAIGSRGGGSRAGCPSPASPPASGKEAEAAEDRTLAAAAAAVAAVAAVTATFATDTRMSTVSGGVSPTSIPSNTVRDEREDLLLTPEIESPLVVLLGEGDGDVESGAAQEEMETHGGSTPVKGSNDIVPAPFKTGKGEAAAAAAAVAQRRSFFDSPLPAAAASIGGVAAAAAGASSASRGGEQGRATGTRTHGDARLLSMRSFEEFGGHGANAPTPTRSPADPARLTHITDEAGDTSLGCGPANPRTVTGIVSRGRTTIVPSPLGRPAVYSGSPPRHRHFGSPCKPSATPTPVRRACAPGQPSGALSSRQPEQTGAAEDHSIKSQQQHLPPALREAGAAGLSGSPPRRTPRRRASLSPGPTGTCAEYSPDARSNYSPGPRRIEPVLAAPSPAEECSSGGGFGVRGRGLTALQVAAESESTRYQKYNQLTPPAQRETARPPPVIGTPPSRGVRVGYGASDRTRLSNGRRVCNLEPLARKLPAFLVRAVGLSGSLRSLASCQAVSRGWRDALGGDRGKELFGSTVRMSGIPADLRPAVWQTLVLRAVGGGGDKDRRGSGVSCGSGGGGGGGRDSFSSSSFSSSMGSFAHLVKIGRAGPHAALIARDVPRAFGAVAPHKRREDDLGSRTTTATNANNSKRGLATTTTTPRSLASTPKIKQGGRRRVSMGGSENGGEGRGPFGGEGLGFFGGAVGGALTNLLGGGWRFEDDESQRATATPCRARGRGSTPNHRGAPSSTGNWGEGCDVGGRLSWLTPGASSGAGSPGGRDGRSASPPGERGGFTLASFPLSPFGNLLNNDTPRGGRSFAGPRPPSPVPSPMTLGIPDAPTEEAGPGDRVSPPRANRRATIGGGGGGFSPRKTGGRREWSPTVREVRGNKSAAARGKPTAEVAETMVQQPRGAAVEDDAAWLAGHDEAWAAVPVESKRQCLENVLLAVAARFPGVGYCQGMDRLLILLMMFYFVSPEDTGTADAGGIASALSPVTGASPPPAAGSTVPSLRRGVRGNEPRGFGSGDGRFLLMLENDAADADVAPSPAYARDLPPNPANVADVAAAGRGEGDECGAGGYETLPPPSPIVSARSSVHPRTPQRPPAEPPLLGERVYTVFSGLFEGFRLHDLYVPDRGGVLVCTEVLTLLAGRRLPELTSHFEDIDFSVDMVAMGWFQTLFVYLHAMPRATVRRIWDWWLSSGDFEIFFRVSMALLDLSKDHLMTLDFDETVAYFNNFPEPSVLSPDVLLSSAAAVEVEDGELMYLELQVRERENLEVPSVIQLILRPVL